MQEVLPQEGFADGAVAARLAAGLLLGAALDAVLADPRRGHPVAAFGAAASRAEAALWADSRGRGMTMVAVCLAPVAATGLAGQLASAHRANGRLARVRPSASVAVTGLATWAGGRQAGTEAFGALTTATWPPPAAGCPLCGRDPDRLDAAGLARATVESVAENT